MQSAFGVEHGEISKIAVSRNARKKQRQRQAATTARQEKAAYNAQKIKGFSTKVKSAPSKAVNTKVSIADVGRGAGKLVTGASRLATKSPGVTGAVVLTGGGYGAYRLSQRPDLPKRKQVHQ